MVYAFIDDEPIFNIISKTKLLQLDGNAKILTFDSCKNAIQYFEENIEPLSNDRLVIFLDINMPEMNGFEFLQEFKNRFFASLQAVIFMLSSSIDSVDKETAFQFPFVKNFFSKPFQTSYLDELDCKSSA